MISECVYEKSDLDSSSAIPELEMIRDSYTIDFTNEIKVLLILYGSLMHYVLLRC